MFSSPKYGWTDIHLEDDTGLVFDAPASYLTSVHFDTIEAFTNFYKTRKPQGIYYDAEGWDYIIVITWEDIVVIERKDEYKLYTFNINYNELCDQVISDIERDFNDWADFCFYGDDKDKEKEHSYNAIRLTKSLEELKQAKENFNKRHKRITFDKMENILENFL